jgi:peptidyl-prolyl cis-trans isomerase SurA
MSRIARLAAFSALLLSAVQITAQEPDKELVDGIAAQVGKRVVLVSEVMRFIAPQEAKMRAAGAPESEIAKLRAQALEAMIESRLVEEMVEKADLHASDDEVDRTIESIARENGLSLEQLKASVVFHGMSFDEYREQIKRDLERRNVVNAVVGSKVKVEDAEVKRLYHERFANQPQGGEAVHVRQLLVTYGGTSKRTQAQACARVDAAGARVQAGEDFASVSKEITEVAPQDGGDIGWLHLDSVAPWMSEALATLAPGDTSKTLALPFGCTLLNLVERREFAPVSFEQARERLSQEIYEQKLEAAYRKWIDDLREKTYIDRRGYFADAARFGTPSSPVAPQAEDSLR